MKYLTPQNVILIHFEIIEATSGFHGVRDTGLLKSAVERPRTTFDGKELYTSIFLKAASLVHSLLLNHPFVDGNKRTSVISMIEFLELNGKSFKAEQKELVDFALWVVKKKPSVEEIAFWINKHV